MEHIWMLSHLPHFFLPLYFLDCTRRTAFSDNHMMYSYQLILHLFYSDHETFVLLSYVDDTFVFLFWWYESLNLVLTSDIGVVYVFHAYKKVEIASLIL